MFECPLPRRGSSTMRHSKFFVVALLILACAWQALAADAPTIPPAVAYINPHGLKRGSTALLTVDGRNIADTRWVLFDAPGLTAKVLEVKDVPEEAKVVRP